MYHFFKRVLSALLVVLFFLPSACSEKPIDSVAAEVTQEKIRPSDIKVSDGDTVNIKGERIRLLGIDSPEMPNASRFDGSQEPEASKAKEHLEMLLANAKEVTIERSKRPDQYGRTLGYIIADGKNLNAEMVRAKQAWETISFYGKNGMPERAAEVSAAAELVGDPSFEKPNLWRKKHTK